MGQFESRVAGVERVWTGHPPIPESDDEYFNYGLGDVPTQGRWQIYGLYLPDDVLAKVYYQNALKVLGLQDFGWEF